METELDIEVADIDHVAIRVSDLDKALDFYHGLLGLPIRDKERYEADAIPYVAVVTGGRQLHLMPVEESVHGDGEHICILVRSKEAESYDQIVNLLDRLRTAGITVEEGEPKQRYGTYGRAWAAYIRDPDGRRIELKIH